MPIPARTRLCLRQPVLSPVTSRNCRKLSGCCDPSYRERQCSNTDQSISCKGYPEVRASSDFRIVTKSVHLSFCQNISHSSLAPLASRIAKDLGPFLLVTSEDTLTLVLEALSVVVEIEGDWMTTQLAGDLVTAVLDVWTKNVKGISPWFHRSWCYYSLIFILRPHLHISNQWDPRNYRSLPLPRCIRSID